MTGELTGIAREDRNCEDQQRHDSQGNRRGETMERKEKPGHARCDRRDQKPLHPPIESVSGEVAGATGRTFLPSMVLSTLQRR